jgi:DNA invertase Pin-like site-specific DNA recombinase
MDNALIVKGTMLPTSRRERRAAQYVRMSTELQRYSIENQAAAIAAYARARDLTIVQTYRDEGESGLRLKNRRGLIRLLDDVQSGRADYGHILVYDVSRWGRFQDVDESAHHEFTCRQAGIKVAYCAEQFDNDGSLLSSIVKNIKRVMAAEYSRELSLKVHTGLCRIAGLGFRVGGPLTFGLRREMVGQNRRSKGLLARGERKLLQTDRVRLALGSKDETTVVRWIFEQFALDGKSYAAICRQLNQANIANHHGRPWTGSMIRSILRNENYLGNVVYNRTSSRLGQKLVNNPRERWIRSDVVLAPIVDQVLFARAQTIMDDRWISISEEEMLLRLRVLLKHKGELSARIIDSAPGVPCAASYVNHFGSLRKAFALLGYRSPHSSDWIDSRQHWSEVLTAHAVRVANALSRTKCREVWVDKSNHCVVVNGARIYLQVVRQLKRKGSNQSKIWRAHRGKAKSGSAVILRLDEANGSIEDYLILQNLERIPKLARPYYHLSAHNDHGAIRVETEAALIAALKKQVVLAKHARGKPPAMVPGCNSKQTRARPSSRH